MIVNAQAVRIFLNFAHAERVCNQRVTTARDFLNVCNNHLAERREGDMSWQRSKIAILLTAGAICAHAQWLNYPAPGAPRTKDGKVNVSAKPPRAYNGKPDLSGVWLTQYAPPGENERIFGAALKDSVVPGDNPLMFSKYLLNILIDFKPEDSPMRPAAAEIFRKRSPVDSPVAQCMPQSIPRADLHSYAPFKIIQTPGLIAFLYEIDGTHRQVYTDGRKLPEDPQPSWLGYSVGRWEGDTLIVDTAGFNDKSWLDVAGHPHSEALHVEERFRRRDFGHMDLQVTIDDPKMYTRPFTVKVTEVLQADSDILENVCLENERDGAHLRP